MKNWSLFEKRQRKKVIIALLVLTLVLFVYVRKEIFFQQAKRLVEQELARTFQCQFSIGKIKPHLVYGLALENLEINFPKVSEFAFNIKVAEALVDYNLREFLFSGHKDIRTLRLLAPTVNLSYTNAEFAQALQPEANSVLEPGEFALVLENGCLSFGNAPCLLKNLHGRLLINQKGLYFQQIRASLNNNPPDVLSIYGEAEEDELSLTANLEHLQIKSFDILTNLTLSLNRGVGLQDETSKITGTLKTYGSVVNNQPFPELNSSFEIQDGKLRILSCSLGEEYDLRGIVSLQSPPQADLSLNLCQAVPNKLFAQLVSQEDALTGYSITEEPDFSGLVNGLIKISGGLSQPKVEGYLEARQGHLGDLDFVSADINIKGRYPKILIVDSRICREEGSFFMEGEVDFADLEGQDFLGIRLKPDKAIFWEGWDITRKQENQVHMSKNVADDFKVTFDAFLDDESKGYEGNYRNELAVEYKIFGDKLLKLRLKKDEEILGVEQRVKF